MNSLKWSLIFGGVCSAALLAFFCAEVGRLLYPFRAVVMYGHVTPSSRLTNIVGLALILCGVWASVSMGTLVAMRNFGRRSSGAMLRETNANARRGMPGLEGLREEASR